MGIETTIIPKTSSAAGIADNVTLDVTGDDKLEIKEGGVTGPQLSSNLNDLIADALIMGIENGGVSDFSPNGAVADAFTSESGGNDTIDIGESTTATFSVNKYVGIGQITATEDNGIGMSAAPSATAFTGFKITIGSLSLTLVSITKVSGSTATTARLRNASTHANIASATYIGNVATFSSSITLTANASYEIGEDSGTNEYDIGIKNPFSAYPIAGTHITWINAINNTATHTDYALGPESIQVTPQTGASFPYYIQTFALDGLDGSYTQAILSPFNFITNTGNQLTYDIAPTGGSFTITGLQAGEYNNLAIGGTPVIFSGAKLRIAFNQGTGEPSDQPSLQGYFFGVA